MHAYHNNDIQFKGILRNRTLLKGFNGLVYIMANDDELLHPVGRIKKGLKQVINVHAGMQQSFTVFFRIQTGRLQAASFFLLI